MPLRHTVAVAVALNLWIAWVAPAPLRAEPACTSITDLINWRPYCVCDCDRDGSVGVSEVIRGVLIAEGGVALTACPAVDQDQDGRVVVSDLVRAVDLALTGCTLPAPIFGGGLRFRFASVEDGEQQRLTLLTEEQYPCLGHRLDTALRVRDGVVEAVLGCVYPPPGICLTAFGPGEFSTELTLASGTYTLALEADGDTDTYRVEVSAQGVEVELIEASFSETY